MSAAKHTPGPWDKGRAGGIGQVFNADGRKVCDVMTNLGDLNLVAAAPELLEFAMAAMDYLQHPDGHHLPPGAWFKLNEQVRAAIAKATGSAQ